MPPLAIGFSFLVLDFYPERMNGVCVNDDKPARTQSEVPYRPQRLKWQKLVGDQKEECDRRPMQDTGAHWQCCSYLIQYLRHFLGFCHVSGGMAVTGDGKASREVMVWGGHARKWPVSDTWSNRGVQSTRRVPRNSSSPWQWNRLDPECWVCCSLAL